MGVLGRAMTFLYKGDHGERWAMLFARRAPAQALRLWPDIGDPAAVRFLAAWVPPPDLARRFPNLEILFSVGAGVDQFDLDALPPTLPVVRMVEPGIVDGMVEYVCFATLALHRDMPHYLASQRRAKWQPRPALPAARRRVGVLGLGVLGQAVLARLSAFGFDCAGWSRTRHTVNGVRTYAGDDELVPFLGRSDILICLLPLTPATRGILDGKLFSALPAGAALINAGRGPQLIAADLLRALDEGRLTAAVLDVCDPEPLPAAHPFWRHPRIWLTPHVASMTQPETAVDAVLDNLRRHRAGEPLVGRVDGARGY